MTVYEALQLVVGACADLLTGFLVLISLLTLIFMLINAKK